MISKFDASTALLLIDVQKGINDTAYFGGPTGRRNNLGAEGNIISILTKWRTSNRKVAFRATSEVQCFVNDSALAQSSVEETKFLVDQRGPERLALRSSVPA